MSNMFYTLESGFAKPMSILTLSVCEQYIYCAASHACHPDGVLILCALDKIIK
jgi:hypothetical protein